jgi:hypothetical protein
MQGTEIRYSDPAWIGKLRLGAGLVLWGTLASLAGLALEGAIAIDPIIQAQIAFEVVLGGFLICAIGNWLLSSPDPSGAGEKTYGTSRRISRFALFLGAVGAAGLLGATIAHPSLPLRLEFKLADEFCDAVGFIGTVAMLNYVSKLAVRMRDTRIAERARTLRNGFAVTGALLIITLIIRDFVLRTQWAIENDLAGLILSFQVMALLTGLVVWIAWVLLLMRLGTRLKEQATLAGTTWA